MSLGAAWGFLGLLGAFGMMGVGEFNSIPIQVMLQASSFRLPASKLRLQASGFRLQASGGYISYLSPPGPSRNGGHDP